MVATHKLAVLFGGPSPEHEVSVLTGLQVLEQLRRNGHSPMGLYWTKLGKWLLVPAGSEARSFVSGRPTGSREVVLVLGSGGGFHRRSSRLQPARHLPIDAAVVCGHGGAGEDGRLQSALDLAGISYAGPSASGAHIGMDKMAFAGVMSWAGLPTLPRVLLDVDGPGFAGPYIVKPRFGGSSLGIEIVNDYESAQALGRSSPSLRDGAVVEPYKPGAIDLNVALRMYPRFEISAIERPLRAAGTDMLRFADKYLGSDAMFSAPRELPATIENRVAEQIHAFAPVVARHCDLRGIARLDFLLDGEKLWVNEINTIPGSLARYLWVQPALTFSELLDDLVAEAHARPAYVPDTTGATGMLLQSAGSIAGKLA